MEVAVGKKLGQAWDQHSVHGKLGATNQNHECPERILGVAERGTETTSKEVITKRFRLISDLKDYTYLLVQIHKQHSSYATHSLAVTQLLWKPEDIASNNHWRNTSKETVTIEGLCMSW